MSTLTLAVSDKRLYMPSGTQKSLAFNGTSSYVTIPITPSTTGFSIGMWVQIMQAASKQIVNWETAADTDGMQMKYDTNVRDFVWTTNNGASFQTNVSTSLTNSQKVNVQIMKWSHIVYTFGSGGSTMFIDGERTSLNSNAVMSVATGQTLTLGRNSYSAGNYFFGKMKNVTVQNTTTIWTINQVNDLMSKNIIPSGAIQYSMNDTNLDQNGQNGLTLTSTSYSTDVPIASTRLSAGVRSVASALSAERVIFNGNWCDTRIQPLDYTALAVGASSDFSCGAYVYLKGKTEANSAITNLDGHTIVNSDFHFTNNHGYLFQIGGSAGNLTIWSGNASYASSNSLVPYNQWTYVIFTLTGTTAKAYVDGTLVWTQTIARKAGEGSLTTSKFGRENTGISSSQRGLYGFMRDVFSTKTLLDQTAVTNIVSSGSYPTVDIHYKLDEGVGSVAIDYSGNNNHGLFRGVDSPIDLWRHSARQPV